MRNRWSQSAQPRAVWVADLEAVASRPTDMLAVVLDILNAGERHDVLRFHEVPALDWRRDRDPPLAGVIAGLYDKVGPYGQRYVDAFGFTRANAAGGPGDAIVGARLATFDASGEVQEREVLDLAALAAAGGEGARATLPSRPPLTVFGQRLGYRGDPLALVGTYRWPGLTLRLMTYSDIWWPRLAGADADNLALARQHTPRLNAFLADVRASVTGHGGRWSVERAGSGVEPAPTADGIDLSATRAP